MEIRVLGPVELELDGSPSRLGGPKQRAVLSLLALNANSTVSVDRLIEGLWGEQQPTSAAKNVQLYVSQLRKLLVGQRGVEIVTRGRGYELRVDPEAVDALRFERLIRDASGGHRNGGAGEAANRALSLWRGAPLADLVGEPFAAAEARRLEELRLAALELAIESELEAGRHREQIARLDSLVAEHPLRESLHCLRMLALYRAGRQADALEAYRVARSALVEAVGAEPGPELRRLHDAILRQDPALNLEAPELPAELTPDAPVLGGRDAELAVLRSAWREAQIGSGRVLLVQGPAGIGKTRLVAELAGALHSGGASVVYVGGGAPGAAAALERARRTPGPALVVLDDLDGAPPGIVTGAPLSWPPGRASVRCWSCWRTGTTRPPPR